MRLKPGGGAADGQSAAVSDLDNSFRQRLGSRIERHVMRSAVDMLDERGTELEDDEVVELHRLAGQGLGALAQTYGPQGFNLGWNLGRIAGAGVTDHVHLHVVPRWAGDTNFMPVLADVKVLPEHLVESRRKLADAWPS